MPRFDLLKADLTRPKHAVCKDGMTVFPRDLNHANTLFGGEMLRKMDAAAGEYAMEIMHTPSIRTKAIGLTEFIAPARQGHQLRYYCWTLHEGKTHLVVGISVENYNLKTEEEETICRAPFLFVCVDENGEKIPWRDNIPKKG